MYNTEVLKPPSSPLKKELDKYQRALVIGARIKELQGNDPPRVPVLPSLSLFSIAEQELDLGLLAHISVISK